MPTTTRSRKPAAPAKAKNPPVGRVRAIRGARGPDPTTDTASSELVTPATTSPQRPSNCRDIPITQLVPYPDSTRHRLHGITEMADSITEVGVLEPLVVRPHLTATDDGGEVWMIVMGRRRHAGAQQAGLLTLPCIVRDLDDAQAVQDALLSHLHHNSLTPVEEAEQLQRLMTLRALNVTALAKAAARSASFVTGRLALLTLPPEALEALHEGIITVSEAGALTELADYPETIVDLLEGGEGIDSFALEQALRWAGNERERARLRAEAHAKGLRLIEVPPSDIGYAYVVNLDLTPRQVAAHARQSCHAVYLTASLGGPRLVPVCSERARHEKKAIAATTAAHDSSAHGPDTPDISDSPNSSGEEGNEQSEEIRQRAEDLAEAHTRQQEREQAQRDDARNRKRVSAARHDFLSTMATKRAPKRSETLVFVLGAMIEHANHATMAWVGGLLGLSENTGGYGQSDWSTPVATYAAQSGENLLKVAVLISAHWAEEHIHPHTSGYNPFAARYVKLLAGFGYTPDPYEVGQIEGAQQDDASTDSPGHDHDEASTDDTGESDPSGEDNTGGDEQIGDSHGATREIGDGGTAGADSTSPGASTELPDSIDRQPEDTATDSGQEAARG